MSGKVNYGALYLVREMTVWLLCFFFSGCCIPPFAAFSFAAASPAAADADAVAVAVAADFSLPYHIIFLLYNFLPSHTPIPHIRSGAGSGASTGKRG